MANVLVIGYGNTMRGDDALGWCVADRLRKRERPGVEVIASHQLTPEMAEPVGAARRVIFVDAREDIPPGEIRIERIKPCASSPSSFTHQFDPWGLLVSAHELFGGTPVALLVGVGGEDFSLSDTMSPRLTKALEPVIALIKDLIADENHPHWREPENKGEKNHA